MDEKKFGSMVRKLEVSAQTAPELYRIRVGLFAVLGYVVYLSLIVGVLALLGAIVVVAVMKPSAWMLKLGWKVGIPLLILAWSLLRALILVVPVPTGITLTRELVPELFDLVHDVRTRLKVSSLERVLLTTEFNAGVVQLPRFGMLGTRNYLMLGLPLLQALSKDDLKSVIAHEFGHLSGNHSRFSGWVYRAVGSYVQVLHSVGGNKILEGFLNWYVPRLDAFSFPLRRRNEYEADAASAEIVGKERTGQALVNVHVKGALNPDFWKGVKKQVFQTAHPPVALYHDWAARVKTQQTTDAEGALKEALEEETGLSDTHPSLTDRLAKLGVVATVEQAPSISAAEALLGSQYAALVQQAGHQWSADVSEGWQEQHGKIAAARTRITALVALRNERPFTAAEAFEYADLTEDANPDEDALPLFRQVLDLEPQHELARFSVARLLLGRDDAEGVSLMREFETNKNPQLRLAASAILSGYFSRKGDTAAAAESLEKANTAHTEGLARQEAREKLGPYNQFIPHGVSPEAIARLAADLERFSRVGKAYLVQKQLAPGERPLYVLAVDLTLLGRSTVGDDYGTQILNEVHLPGETWCVRFDQNSAFEGPIRAVADSLVYSR